MGNAERTAVLMTPALLAQLRNKPAPDASPAAWLNQLAADAGAGHVRRLVELHQQLMEQARERRVDDVQAALKALDEAACAVDFSQAQPRGWLARATGLGKDAAAGFAAQAERAVQAGEDLKEGIHLLRRRHQVTTAAAQRTLTELAAEVAAIDHIMDQGARWLEDMRNQLRARRLQDPDAAAQKQIEEDSRRCDLLVGRLKELRATNTAARHARELCEAAIEREAALLQALQQLAEAELQAWQDRLTPLAEALRAGRAPDGLEAAKGASRALEDAVERAIGRCRQVAGQHDAFREELAVLARPLAAAA